MHKGLLIWIKESERFMFTTISIYFLMLLLIFWGYCGYFILLFAFTSLSQRKNKKEPTSENLPKIAIIIPCHNEEEYVVQKINNLKALNYEQGKFDVFFLDGMSTDKTTGIIAGIISDMPYWHLIETGCRGKIHQINYGLSKIKDDFEIIVSTDMDTMLSPDVLIKFADEFNSDNRVAVVGANISPQKGIYIERKHWQNQNLIRITESNAYTSSIVVAPCYAYRASFIDSFPEDCVADDIFVAFKANTEGYLTKYVGSATGIELRAPETLEDFVRHKFRKGNAFLIELFRYFYRLPYMPGWFKVIYITKVIQLAIIPWILPFFLLSTISLILSGWGLCQVAVFGLLFLVLFMALTSLMINKAGYKYSTDGNTVRRPSLRLFAIGNLILMLIGLSYPFYKQTSIYTKVGGETGESGGQ